MSPHQVNRAEKLPVNADELGMPKPGRHRSPLPDLLQPRRLAPRHCGEFLVLPMPSSTSISSRRAPASVAADHRCADTPPVMLRWPPGHSATTKWFTIVPWFFLAYSLVRGRSRASPSLSAARRRWVPVRGQRSWPGRALVAASVALGPPVSGSG
jgi:hypothetical protein